MKQIMSPDRYSACGGLLQHVTNGSDLAAICSESCHLHRLHVCQSSYLFTVTCEPIVVWFLTQWSYCTACAASTWMGDFLRAGMLSPYKAIQANRQSCRVWKLGHTMANAERKLIMGIWRRSPQWGLGTPMVKVSGGEAPWSWNTLDVPLCPATPHCSLGLYLPIEDNGLGEQNE